MEDFHSFIVVHSFLAAFSAVVTIHDKTILSNGQLHGVQTVQGHGGYLEDEMTLHVSGQDLPAINFTCVCCTIQGLVGSACFHQSVLIHELGVVSIQFCLFAFPLGPEILERIVFFAHNPPSELFSLHNLNSSNFCLSLGKRELRDGRWSKFTKCNFLVNGWTASVVESYKEEACWQSDEALQRM